MRHLILLALAAPSLALAIPPVPVAPPPQPPQLSDVAGMRDAALGDNYAWNIVEGLTTEVGPRLGGTEAEARARAWAVAKLAEMGFNNVRIEEFDMPTWVRGDEKAEVIAPFRQPLAITALGNSGATPKDGLTAEVVFFPTYADLEAAPDGSLRGKIAYVSHQMRPTQDGSSYGQFGPARFTGPNLAAKKGAAAIVIKSIGTDSHRNPHTGATNFEDGVTPIPAGAISLPDADNLERIFARGRPVRMKLLLTPRNLGTRKSGNVIAEVPGTDAEAGIVLIGGHLDSWDLGTGAVDDGAGVAITAAAAKRIMDAGRPRRTIRLVWFGAEEVGLWGGRDYAERHGGERHALAAESDFGAGKIWRVRTKLPAGAAPATDRLAAALAPLGVVRGAGEAGGGPDIGPLIALGRTGVIDLDQDGLDYFDLHHTPDDTLDKIDAAALKQNVAAWTAMLAVMANAPEGIELK